MLNASKENSILTIGYERFDTNQCQPLPDAQSLPLNHQQALKPASLKGLALIDSAFIVTFTVKTAHLLLVREMERFARRRHFRPYRRSACILARSNLPWNALLFTCYDGIPPSVLAACSSPPRMASRTRGEKSCGNSACTSAMAAGVRATSSSTIGSAIDA